MKIIILRSLANACLRITIKTALQIEAIIFFRHQKISVTWFSDDCMISDCFSDDEGLQEIFYSEISNHFKKEVYKMEKQELFEKAAAAMDNYTKAVEMGLQDFANYYDSKMRVLCEEIKAKGWGREFEDYACVI
ncbi:MAG: hypothetical protein ACI4I6_07125 [Hominimerdicola sp.]